MLHLVSLWLGFAVSAGAPDVPDPGGSTSAATDPAPPTSFGAVLEEAKQRYFRGESTAAKELLEGLQIRVSSGEDVDWGLVADALVYLGEIYFNEGSADRAEVLFRYLLQQDPDTPISAFHHSVAVVQLFETVRGQVVDSRLDPPPPPPEVEPAPVPVWVFLPLGLPQFAQRRPATGLVYGVLEAGLATTSLVLRSQLGRANTDDFLSPEAWEETKVQRVKYLYQWPTTFAFYLTWGVSTVDAVRYHQRHPPALRVSRTPDGTPTLGIAGRL